jgi:hypothetical protein
MGARGGAGGSFNPEKEESSGWSAPDPASCGVALESSAHSEKASSSERSDSVAVMTGIDGGAAAGAGASGAEDMGVHSSGSASMALSSDDGAGEGEPLTWGGGP